MSGDCICLLSSGRETKKGSIPLQPSNMKIPRKYPRKHERQCSNCGSTDTEDLKPNSRPAPMIAENYSYCYSCTNQWNFLKEENEKQMSDKVEQTIELLTREEVDCWNRVYAGAMSRKYMASYEARDCADCAVHDLRKRLLKVGSTTPGHPFRG